MLSSFGLCTLVGETCFRTSCSDETLISPETTRPTQKPSFVNNVGIKQNYCSSSRAMLDTVCKNGITCNPGEPACPPGTACWGSHMCNGISEPTETAETGASSLEAGAARPTLKPIALTMKPAKPEASTVKPTVVPTNRPIAFKPSNTRTHYCASSVLELDARCGLATECTGSSAACGAGQSCLPYDCRQALDKCPLNFSGYHSVSCKTYYQCRNGVVSSSEYSCGVGMAFDKNRKRCVRGDLVDQYCNGLPEGADVSDTTLGSGATQFCPKDFVGIQASADCKGKHELISRTNGHALISTLLILLEKPS